MAPKEYIRLLATDILNEDKIITYRTLSRKLEVHSNAAKRMLFEFYSKENARRPGSVHATYLISGGQPSKNDELNGVDNDVHMRSSPFFSSSMPSQDEDHEMIESTGRRTEVLTRVVTLVREDQLEEAKARYTELYSIHIYSLGPGYIKNLQILSDCNRQVREQVAKEKEDPLITGAKYGVIQNPAVKRRTGGRPPAPPLAAPKAAVKAAPKAVPSTTKPPAEESEKAVPAPAPTPKPELKKESSALAQKTTASKLATKAAVKPGAKVPPVKRSNSDIFKAFSKSNQPKLARGDSGASAATPQTGSQEAAEDEPMKNASESEQENDDLLPPPKATSSARQEARSAREEKLRKMMDDSEDEAEADAMDLDPNEEPPPEEPAAAQPVAKEAAEEVPTVTVSGGRRRGRRKVMKKKMIKDEDGYLVTKEEPAWESFSEDEPAPPAPANKAKIQSTGNQSSSATVGAKGGKAGGAGKGKKGGGADGKGKGKGDIMSFFGKKG